jgi:hypothetical protein
MSTRSFGVRGGIFRRWKDILGDPGSHECVRRVCGGCCYELWAGLVFILLMLGNSCSLMFGPSEVR